MAHQSIQTILTETFGHPQFVGPQKEVIQRTLDGHHSLVLAPTGSGKSLCYQLPAVMLDGCAIVISPLIALMNDQVTQLNARNIPATFVNSSLPKKERESRVEKLMRGEFDLFYVTPERFHDSAFVDALQNTHISLLVVDEAHCISEWGHDFRPDYSRIAEFRKILNNPPTIALTATATPAVQKDIIQNLGLPTNAVKIFHQGIDRPNLLMSVKHIVGPRQKHEAIQHIQTRVGGQGIIYFVLIRTLLDFTQSLQSRNIPFTIYHGDLDARTRHRNQAYFINGDVRLILATNAFGMGINKSDIRYIIHAEVPGSIEAYYQEIGRAGRDGLPAECTLLYDEDDLATQLEFIQWANPDSAFYIKLYQLLTEKRDAVLIQGVNYLREQMVYKKNRDFRVEAALKILDRYHVTEGSVESQNYRIVSKLPDHLTDNHFLEKKRHADQKKLFSLVRYIRSTQCRKQLISAYFGLPYTPPCGNCDNCLKGA